MRPALALAALAFLLHIIVNFVTPYGFHRDEFLYLAMARHLDLWAMDFPPFIALAGLATLESLGGSLVAVRFLPAVAAAIIVLLTVLATRRLGGGTLAQLTAGLAVGLSPVFLRSGSLFQPVVFDQLWWTAALLTLLHLGRLEPSDREASRGWLVLGAVLGLGLLTKFSIAFIGVGITAAVLLTPLRRQLLTPWPWLALLVALAIGSPSVVGQWRLDFPVVSQMQDLQTEQLDRITPLGFLLGQWDNFNLMLLLALAGLAHILRGRDRAVGLATLVTFVLVMLLRGKPYYVAPIFPVLFAAGAVAVELLAARLLSTSTRVALRWAPIAVILAFGVIAFPIGVPILAPEQLSAWTSAIGATSTTNTGEVISLPQDFADMMGWEDQVDATARAWATLTPAEQREAVILGTNYGRAGAHDHLGTALGMPPAIAPVGSYWYWGPGPLPGRVMIVIGLNQEDMETSFDSVTLAERVTGEWRVPEERDVPIWIGREPHRTLQELWPDFEGQH
ncbi:MAG TPA: glycosyltransferase family 39 protein [Gemmatimonadales bacterium]|nr:glycosyltransferase family 39 protein [Gemmatimonadales bacterium]